MIFIRVFSHYYVSFIILPVESPFSVDSASFSLDSFSSLEPFSLVSFASPFSDAFESSSSSCTIVVSSSTTFFSGVVGTLVSLNVRKPQFVNYVTSDLCRMA